MKEQYKIARVDFETTGHVVCLATAKHLWAAKMIAKAMAEYQAGLRFVVLRDTDECKDECLESYFRPGYVGV